MGDTTAAFGEPALKEAQASTGAARVPAASARIAGLDTIRFVCAWVVLVGHLGFIPLPEDFAQRSVFAHVLAAMYGNLFAGPAAVIVFFVISGFCIHYPYRGSAPIPYASYYARRYVRILAPMLAAILLGRAVGVNLGVLNDSILWSLVCEEIYYLLYPLLRRLGARFGFRRLTAVAYAASLLVVLTNPTAGDYASYGVGLNWLLGLPCWLLGCELAEVVRDPRPTPSVAVIWGWRLGLWALGSFFSVLRFHSPIKYPWTLNLFAFAATLWLVREIAYRRAHPAPALLERGGRWSYSLYLVHLPAWSLFGRLALPDPGPQISALLELLAVTAFCYAFARAVEFPSHRLARSLGERLLARQARPSP